MGLHSYAGKASYVRSEEGNHAIDNLGPTSNLSNIAVVRPQQQQKNNSTSSTMAGTGNINNDLAPIEPPRNRRWFNLFGVIDTDKLGNLCSRGMLGLI